MAPPQNGGQDANICLADSHLVAQPQSGGQDAKNSTRLQRLCHCFPEHHPKAAVGLPKTVTQFLAKKNNIENQITFVESNLF
ncbi:hypothetical protein, partial [Faecalibaculum rodentium]|uniref:hypothetical protein n=1 Tax=Faecalibaculum rodentium TaxID=1702221 RepID=UPI0023F31CDB